MGGYDTAVEEARAALIPVIIGKGMDDYYARSGEEYIAYQNLLTAQDNLELAHATVEEN